MRDLIVEGWRFLPHSYALVNQYQCLEFLKRDDVGLSHRDVPYLESSWQSTAGLLPPHQEAAVRSIPAPRAGVKADALLRMGFPLFFHASGDARRTFTWGTAELLLVDQSAIGGGKTARMALENAESTIVTCSNWAARGFINSGAAPEQVAVVPCGVDPAVFHPATPEARQALRRKFGWEDKFVALNVSACTGNKGVDLCMRALAQLAAARPELNLALKGADALYRSHEFVQDWLARMTPAEAAVVMGRMAYHSAPVSSLEIAQMYQAADLYLSPYRADGFNLPVLEAAACGLPVIATRGGPTDDFADDTWCRRLDARLHVRANGVATLEPEAAHVAAVLDDVISDSGWRAAASQAGPAWVVERYTWKHSVDRLLQVMFPD